MWLSVLLYTGEVNRVIEAIHYAEKNGAQICNMSLSFQNYNQEMEKVMRESKMLFVVSAGNQAMRGLNIDFIPSYPASYNLPNMIVVANLSYDGKLNAQSNFGSKSVDVSAPGTCIYSTDVNGSYGYLTGTSMAAPIVSGIAALVYLVTENPNAEKVKDIICKSVDEKGNLIAKTVSGGIVDGKAAVEKAFQYNLLA